MHAKLNKQHALNNNIKLKRKSDGHRYKALTVIALGRHLHFGISRPVVLIPARAVLLGGRCGVGGRGSALSSQRCRARAGGFLSLNRGCSVRLLGLERWMVQGKRREYFLILTSLPS